MVQIKLYYFDVRGRGETSRLILNYAKVPFEDVVIPEDDTWPARKSEFPLGQLPLLEVDGAKISQSQAINRYLAKKFGLAGKGELEEAKVDETVELYREFSDASSPFVMVSLGYAEGDKDQVRKEKLLPALEKYAPLFKKLIDESGSGFFVKSGPTYADFFISEMLTTIHNLEKDLIESKYPYLLEHIKRVHALPQLKEYLSKRKETIV